RGLDAAVSCGAHTAHDGEAVGQPDRKADLSRELLPSQGALREGGVRDARDALRRHGADDDGGADHAARGRTKDGEPGAHPRFQEPAEYLRRYARASHLEPARMGDDTAAR